MVTPVMARDELPFWMRRTLRGTDWGVLIVLAFCLLVSAPFLSYQGAPIGTAFERYAFRTADVARSFREGRLYPRWTNTILGGYGAPILNYLPPLPGILPALVDVTLVNNPEVSVILVFIGAQCLAGSAIYALIARGNGAATGLTAAILYVFNPFVGYIVPQELGDLTFALAAALLPILLWAVDRIMIHSERRDIVLASVAMGALWLTDPRFAAVGILLTLALGAAHFARRTARRWRALVVAFILGTGLAGCFWLPALLESSAVQWYPQEIVPIRLLHPSTLFSLPPAVDSAAMTTLPTLTLGVIPVMAALLGLLLMLRQPDTRWLVQLSMAGCALVLLIIAIFKPDQVWMLVPIALCLAISGSAALRLRDPLPDRYARLVLVGLAALAIGSALSPWLSTHSDVSNQASPDFSAQVAVNFEQRGYGIPILPPGAPFPSTIPPETAPNASLIRSFSGGVPSRVEQVGSAQIGVLADNAHDLHLQIQTYADTTLHILTAYFPGWSARLADQSIPISRDFSNGLMSLRLAQGQRGELVVSLETTLARLAGWMVTWSAIGVVAWLLLRRSSASASIERLDDFELLSHQETRLFTVLMIVVGCLLIVPLEYPSLGETLGWSPHVEAGLAESEAFNLRSDAGLELLAYDLPVTQVRAGSSFDLTLYWRAIRPLQENYRVQAALRDRSTNRVDTLEAVRHPGDLPTGRWTPRHYVPDFWQIDVPETLSLGEYDIVMAVFACDAECSTRTPLNFFDTSGVPLGKTFALPLPVTIISN